MPVPGGQRCVERWPGWGRSDVGAPRPAVRQWKTQVWVGVEKTILPQLHFLEVVVSHTCLANSMAWS